MIDYTTTDAWFTRNESHVLVSAENFPHTWFLFNFFASAYQRQMFLCYFSGLTEMPPHGRRKRAQLYESSSQHAIAFFGFQWLQPYTLTVTTTAVLTLS